MLLTSGTTDDDVVGTRSLVCRTGAGGRDGTGGDLEAAMGLLGRVELTVATAGLELDIWGTADVCAAGAVPLALTAMAGTGFGIDGRLPPVIEPPLRAPGGT